MPTYTYQCDCGCRFVQSRSIKDDVGWQYCPECHKRARQLVTGGVTTILVGTNWAGKQAKMDADAEKLMRDGGEYVNNPDYWAENE
jgi:putative FmdB family regulatory protein